MFKCLNEDEILLLIQFLSFILLKNIIKNINKRLFMCQIKKICDKLNFKNINLKNVLLMVFKSFNLKFIQLSLFQIPPKMTKF